MPDLVRTRKNMKTTLAVLLGVDVLAAAILFSPLVGSANSRQQEMNLLKVELITKTQQVKPLKNLDVKVALANRQIIEFSRKRFPTEDSQIATRFGKLAAEDSVTIGQEKYKMHEDGPAHLRPVELDADLSGTYVSLAKFINALERDDMLFIINSVTLGSESAGPIKLQMKLETYLKAGG
jgi:hypothetical protein